MTRLVRHLLWILTVSVMVTACNEGGSGSSGSTGAPPSSSPPPASNPPPANQAPRISLSSQSVLVGRELRARPTASDPDGQSLTFSISNRPSWLSFNSQTGEIYGTPADADVGTYDNVRITASDGQAETSVTISITVTQSTTGRATLSWNAPSQRTDGTPLTDLAGFRVYYGNSGSDLRYVIEIKDPGARSWVIENLTAGTWYFAATAFDISGAESDRSNTASKAIA